MASTREKGGPWKNLQKLEEIISASSERRRLAKSKRYGVTPVSPATAIDAKLDQLYSTVTTEDIPLYNHGGEPLRAETPSGPIDVLGHTIVTLPR